MKSPEIHTCSVDRRSTEIDDRKKHQDKQEDHVDWEDSEFHRVDLSWIEKTKSREDNCRDDKQRANNQG